MNYPNKDEYDGQWRLLRHGEGVFKEASTGRVERRLYKDYDFEEGEVKEVIEVIEQGH